MPRPRRRNSNQKCKKGAEMSHNNEPIQSWGRSITDLPTPIIANILLKLPVKTVFACKCVSKEWRSLISDPQFAKLHFSGQEAWALLRTLGSTHVSRTLYLVEPEICSNFDLGYCDCLGDYYSDQCIVGCHIVDPGYCDCYGAYYTDQCVKNCHIKLDTKLKIPLRNAEMVVNGVVDDGQRSFLSAGYVFKRKRAVEHKFKIVNSCHGFLCLCEPSNNEPVVVCNPITGEYTNLPVAQKYGSKGLAGCGFGFSPRTNQYKVIRMICQLIFGESSLTNLRRTEIHTLGTGSWKSIGGCPDPLYGLAFPTYLEGCIHWICIEPRTFPNYIVSFNFDNEQFQSVPPPPCKSDGTGELGLEAMSNVSMGVLEGYLCICEASNYIDIWIMKKYGVQESWTKVFSIDTDEWCPIGLYQPIKYLKDGALLMFHYVTSSLICYDPNGPQFKCLKVFGINSKFEAIAHIPSFISLKEAVTGDNAVVQNIYSRCAAFKVPEETLDLSLVEKDGEKDRDTTFDLDNSSSDADKWRRHLFVFDTFNYIPRCSGFD